MEKELYIKTALVELVQEGDNMILIQNYQPANQDPLNQDRWWITKERFKETYTPVTAVFPDSTERFDFGTAIAYMKEGKKVKRSHWGGYWFLAKTPELTEYLPNGYLKSARLKDSIFAVLKDGGGVVPATPYQEDILAIDWEVIE